MAMVVMMMMMMMMMMLPVVDGVVKWPRFPFIMMVPSFHQPAESVCLMLYLWSAILLSCFM